MFVPVFAFVQGLFLILLGGMAIFLILLVLVQRGRGGGLAGALGGMGGSSAFGAKAGDVFTRITIIAAAVWIVLCLAATKITPSSAGGRLNVDTGGASNSGPVLPGGDQKKEGDAQSSPVDSSTPASSESSAAPAEKTAPASDASGAAPADKSKSE